MALPIDDLPIGGAAAMGDPDTGTGAHHRLQSGDDPAGRHLHLDLLVLPVVDIGFPVGDDQELLPRELLPEKLPQRFREAFLLCEIQGLSYEDASAILNCPVKTVSTRLFRARQRFRAAVGDLIKV